MNNCKNGKYNFYNGAKSPVSKMNDYSYSNNDDYILLIKDGGAGKGKYGESIGLGKCFYVNGANALQLVLLL